jgi:stage III sporulation protein AF
MLGMSGWLKTVITVIMLATFVDLLLPSSTMQRYVRTVMSLFVLLTLLSPFVQFFQRSWQPERLYSLIEDEQARMAAAEEAGGAMPTLEAIRRKAEQLKAANAQQEKRLVETQLAEQIRQRLQGETELAIAAVRVTTTTDKNDKPYIQDVQVTLGPPDPTAAASAGNPDPQAASSGTAASPLGKPSAIEIKPVDPVRIRIGDDTDHYKSAAAVAAGGGALPAPYRQDQAAVTRVLAKEYQISPDRIRVLYSGSAAVS